MLLHQVGRAHAKEQAESVDQKADVERLADERNPTKDIQRREHKGSEEERDELVYDGNLWVQHEVPYEVHLREAQVAAQAEKADEGAHG